MFCLLNVWTSVDSSLRKYIHNSIRKKILWSIPNEICERITSPNHIKSPSGSEFFRPVRVAHASEKIFAMSSVVHELFYAFSRKQVLVKPMWLISDFSWGKENLEAETKILKVKQPRMMCSEFLDQLLWVGGMEEQKQQWIWHSTCWFLLKFTRGKYIQQITRPRWLVFLLFSLFWDIAWYMILYDMI